MVGTAEVVIAICDGVSPGTMHSIDYATSQGKPVFVLRPEINKAADRLQPNGTLIRSSGDGWASLGAVRS